MPSQTCIVNGDDPPEEAWDDPVRGRVTWRTLLSGDRTPSEGLTLGVAEVNGRSDEEAKLHRHAQPEAYYVLSGRGVLHLGAEQHSLSPGVTAFIPGGVWHAARRVGAEPLRLLYVFAADSFADVIYEFPEPPAEAQ